MSAFERWWYEIWRAIRAWIRHHRKPKKIKYVDFVIQ